MKPENELRFWSAFCATWLLFVLLCLFTLFSGCGANFNGPPVFETRCGMRIQNVPEIPRAELEPWWWTPENVQRVENATEAAFQRTLDPRLINYCQGIRGWKVYAFDEWSWTGNEVNGETICGNDLMLVNGAAPGRSSLPHEIAHALQRCWPMSSRYEGGHADWGSQGILNAIDDVWGQEWDLMLDAGYRP